MIETLLRGLMFAQAIVFAQPITALAQAGAAGPTTAALTYEVADADQLHVAVRAANQRGGHATIVLRPGVYRVSGTLQITGPGITLRSTDGRRDGTIIEGDAMSDSARIHNLIRVDAPRFVLDGITLQKSRWHLIQVAGELDADHTVLRNCVLRDSFQQLFKVSYNGDTPNVSADDGLIEDCLFEYSAGIGPQWYIGGIDVHGGKRWTVRRNTFRSIISPSKDVAEFAIHFWTGTADNVVEQNLIIDCDRGIGFGLAGRGNERGVIRNNAIYHSGRRGQFADVGIYLEKSPGTQVIHNTVILESRYRRAIEFRYPETRDVLIANNLTNRAIAAMDGGTATVRANVTGARQHWFADASVGDLRLSAAAPQAALRVPLAAGADRDLRGQPRAQGQATAGAFEPGP